MTSTYLANLVKIGSLDLVPVSRDLIERIAASARQQFKDSAIEQASNETRFDCAYNAIRAVADVGLLLQGYRPSTKKPGHHQISIQALEHTLKVDSSTIRVLDALRRQRSGSNYEGDLVTDAALAECHKQARSMVALLDAALGPK
jgi:hypothetical protein